MNRAFDSESKETSIENKREKVRALNYSKRGRPQVCVACVTLLWRRLVQLLRCSCGRSELLMFVGCEWLNRLSIRERVALAQPSLDGKGYNVSSMCIRLHSTEESAGSDFCGLFGLPTRSIFIARVFVSVHGS